MLRSQILFSANKQLKPSMLICIMQVFSRQAGIYLLNVGSVWVWGLAGGRRREQTANLETLPCIDWDGQPGEQGRVALNVEPRETKNLSNGKDLNWMF